MSESASGEANGSTTCRSKGSSETCEYCGRELSDESSLTRHLRLRHADKLDHSCPSCEQVFSTDRGLKLHHSRTHGEKIKRGSEVCDNCGETFKFKQSRRENPRFCESECRDAYQTGPEHPNYQGGKEEVVCEWCGESKFVNPNKADDRRFCDKWCAGKWRSHTQVGDNNPVWEGGKLRYYGPNWDRQRRKALRRDQYRCRECGATEQNLGCVPSVHHRKPLREFKDEHDAPEWYEKGNDLSNLITLCETHHRKWEQMPVQPEVNNE